MGNKLSLTHTNEDSMSSRRSPGGADSSAGRGAGGQAAASSKRKYGTLAPEPDDADDLIIDDDDDDTRGKAKRGRPASRSQATSLPALPPRMMRIHVAQTEKQLAIAQAKLTSRYLERRI
jgi:hypothetical protein